MVLGFKRGCPGNHGEESGSVGPEIDSFIVSSSQQDLRSQVEGGSDDGQHVPARSSLVELFGNAEVDDLDPPIEGIVEHIFWLDIAMADIPFVYEGEGLQEFGKDEPEGLRVATITSSSRVLSSLRLG